MFESFFPKPKLFFISFAAWSIFCVIAWFIAGKEAGDVLSLGGVFGLGFPAELAPDAEEAAMAAYMQAQSSAGTFWVYQYMIISYAIFLGYWQWSTPHKWSRWSVFGSAAIIS